MGTIDTYTYDQITLTAQCNQIKEMTVRDLVNQKILTEKDADQYLKTRIIFIYKPSMLGKLWMKLNGKHDEENRITLSFTAIED